ncbi:MAG TPA: hypothetical protein VM639_22930 [Dongiaceae bacterium]|nr:hypothetical protein [Dongiaceae bacterium]
MTQLRCSGGETVHLQARVDRHTFDHLDHIRSAYQGMTGKDVTASVIVRRAIRRLSDHLSEVNTQRSIDAELSALLLVR